jgi:wobble nucleotide-excising tRNase
MKSTEMAHSVTLLVCILDSTSNQAKATFFQFVRHESSSQLTVPPKATERIVKLDKNRNKVKAINELLHVHHTPLIKFCNQAASKPNGRNVVGNSMRCITE